MGPTGHSLQHNYATSDARGSPTGFERCADAARRSRQLPRNRIPRRKQLRGEKGRRVFRTSHGHEARVWEPGPAELTDKCANAPQLVAHLSKMNLQAQVLPALTSVSISAFEPSSHTIHWPR